MSDTNHTAARLFLHEEILLLALHDEKGTTAGSASFAHAVGGAIVAEMLLLNRIVLVKPKKIQLVEVANPTPMSDALLDECLERMIAAKRSQSVVEWVSRFARIKRLKHRVAESLCTKSALRTKERKVLLVFNRSTYPTADPAPERALVERIRRSVVDGEVPDGRTLVVVSLAHGTGLLAQILGKRVVKERKEWVKHLVEGDAVGAATKEAVQAAQVAMMLATTVIIPPR